MGVLYYGRLGWGCARLGVWGFNSHLNFFVMGGVYMSYNGKREGPLWTSDSNFAIYMLLL